MKRITIKDIAGELGLSVSAVSMVLNDKPNCYCSEAIKKKILETARALGYIRNASARALVTGKTHNIALITRELGAFQTGIANAISDTTAVDGYCALIAINRDENISRYLMSSLSADGVVVFGRHDWADQCTNQLRVPVVSVWEIDDYDSVVFDLYKPSCEAVEHLIEMGCRKVALVSIDAPYTDEDARALAYRQVMQAHGIKPTHIKVGSERFRLAASEYIMEYVKSNDAPDGIFCFNDDLAIGIISGLSAAGYRVPDDVAVVGCDGIDDGVTSNPPISTIQSPIAQISEYAWRMLHARMQDSSLQRQVRTVETGLSIRGSSLRNGMKP